MAKITLKGKAADMFVKAAMAGEGEPPVRVQPVVSGSRKWVINHAPCFRRGGVGFVMRGPEAGNCNVEVTLPASAGIAKCELVAKAILDALNAANSD